MRTVPKSKLICYFEQILDNYVSLMFVVVEMYPETGLCLHRIRLKLMIFLLRLLFSPTATVLVGLRTMTLFYMVNKSMVAIFAMTFGVYFLKVFVAFMSIFLMSYDNFFSPVAWGPIL